jgi:hypothetical protein
MDFGWFFAGFASGIGFCLITAWLVFRLARHWYFQDKGSKGRAARAVAENETDALIIDFLQEFQKAKSEGKDWKTVLPSLPQIALKHPSAALRLGKKLTENGLEGIL